MKHGPIALLDEGSPVVVVATDGRTYDKLVSNIQEVKARGARVIAVASEGNDTPSRRWPTRSSTCRGTDEMLSPLLTVVPLQLFAYYVAKATGRDGGPAAQPGQDGHGGVRREAGRCLSGLRLGYRPRPGGGRALPAALAQAPAASRNGSSPRRKRPTAEPGDPVPHLAARFAAKEAVGKLLGTGVAVLAGDRGRRPDRLGRGAPERPDGGPAGPRSRVRGGLASRLTHTDALAAATARGLADGRTEGECRHDAACSDSDLVTHLTRSSERPAAFTPAQVRELDRVTIEDMGVPGPVLMERAALGVSALDPAPLSRPAHPDRVRPGQQRRRRAGRRPAAAPGRASGRLRRGGGRRPTQLSSGRRPQPPGRAGGGCQPAPGRGSRLPLGRDRAGGRLSAGHGGRRARCSEPLAGVGPADQRRRAAGACRWWRWTSPRAWTPPPAPSPPILWRPTSP